MAHKVSFAWRPAIALASSLIFSLGVAVAQARGSDATVKGLSSGTPTQHPTASRLAGDWRGSAAVRVASSQPPAPLAALNLGLAPSGARLERMLLLLEPSPAQEIALTAKLKNQLDPASPEYHHWLTPAALAEAYANSATDVAAVSDWLRSQNFKVGPLPASRGWIEFSGTASQVEQAFHTQVHLVATAHGTRALLTSGISVPAALLPVVHGLVSLDGSLSTPALTTPQPVAASAAQLAGESSLSRAAALTPQLSAQLLHLDALYNAGTTGTGESIAIPSRSNVRSEDIAAFRSSFSLPASELKIIANGPDPGRTDDEVEAVLAASWAGAAAPGAQIVLVPASSTSATDGLDLALAGIVDQVLAHTVAVGYAACEASLSETHQAFYAALYKQAAAEGIAVVAATGNSGPAACHTAGSDTRVTSGYGVNALAATPWNTAVGVSAFGVAGPAAGASEFTGWSPVSPADPAYAGGGGKSVLYAAPSWQPIPAQTSATAAGGENSAGFGPAARLLPDLTLPTAIDTGANRGLAFCLSGSTGGPGCTLVRAGGSSASAAIFSGIAALLAGKYGPQGNLAPNLYSLSRLKGIFNDVQHGSAQLPCVAGTPGCAPTDLIGFTATPGFDMATGLGTVNAHALVIEWKIRPMAGTDAVNLTLSVSPIQLNSTYNPSAQVTLTANVLSLTGNGTPTGTVIFYDNSSNAVLSSTPSTLDSNGTATLALEGVFAIGGNELVAIYSGDTVYAPLTSQPPININMQPSTTILTVVPSNFNPAAGATISVVVTLTVGSPPAGSVNPSGLITLNLDGLPNTAALLSTTGGVTSASLSLLIPVSSTLHQHALQATYAGDGNYSASTSPAVTVTVAKGATTSAVTPATTTPYAGNSLGLTATITASSPGSTPPSGTFAFTLDGAGQGIATITPGTPSIATLTITAPATGNHTLAGAYSGDTNYTGSTAPDVTLAVAKVPTTLVVVPQTSTPAPGAPLLLTATLTPLFVGATVPTGTVTFSVDGTTQGTAPLVNGTSATLTITAPSAGSHTLQVTYGGDTNYVNSTSPTVTINAAKITTTLVLTPATTTPTAGGSLVVNATLTPASAGTTLPSGNVVFTLDGTTVGTVAVTPGSPATASVTITTPTPGVHNLAATYSGDNFFNTSISPTVSITVAKSPTSTVVTPATVTPTAGGSLQVTAFITATSPGTTPPSGTVNFSLDGVSQGVQAVMAGSPATATITLPIITAGSHTLVGTYSGDTFYAGSISTTVTLVVAKGASAVTVAATPSILSIGSTETLTATVGPLTAVTGTTVFTFTGTVSFYDHTAVGTVLLGAAVIASNSATLSGVALSGSLDHSITAVYSGDTNWLPSTSPPLVMLAITQPVVVVLTSNASTLKPGQPAILTATVTPVTPPAATAEQNPTGNVIFYNGTTVLGTAALVPAALGNSSTAILTIALPGGQDLITAYYGGDLAYQAGTSNTLVIGVEDFTITPSPTNPPTNLNIVKGSSGSAAFVVTGLGGFNDQVQIVCAVPSQDVMTCTASPQQLIPTGVVTFVVQTFLSGSATASNSEHGSPWGRAAGGAALAVLGFFLLPFGRRARILVNKAGGRTTRRLMMLLLLLAGVGGAGIGCNSANFTSSNGTPLGVATFKITASANVNNTVYSKSVYLTVNVVTPGSTTP